ncbi:hypothetical protein ACFT30_07515 [Microbacterium ureisolvens]|uniref:hypothetical protein n=1 Tax=Microbacterium ureisolvens TaxID=2781186 RepID=UPI00363CE845
MSTSTSPSLRDAASSSPVASSTRGESSAHATPATTRATTPAAGATVGARIGDLFIERTLNGPRRHANGGFAAGSIAQHVEADSVTVVLERPIPLARQLEVRDDVAGGAIVWDGRRVVARARPGRLTGDHPVPAAPSFTEALAARARHPLAGVRHPLSDCVVCGPDRADGMHVTPGFVPDSSDRLVAPWTVDVRFAHAGLARYPAVWAALDCPSYPARALAEGTVCLLGTMTACVERRPRVGEHLVVHSWTREQHGRRYETSATMVDAAGGLVARADATWVALKHQRALGTMRWLR